MSDKDIKTYISSQSENFYEYLKVHAIKHSLLEIVESLSKSQKVYILSGIIRDFFLGITSSVRDIDFVIENSPRILIKYRDELSDTDEIKSNSFKGLKINFQGNPTIDVWEIASTWGIKKKNIEKPTINDLIDSVFFNFSAIVYDLQDRKFIFSDRFVSFFKTKDLDIVFSDNPNIPLCLFNIFYYAQSLHLGISYNLKRWINQNYNHKIDFDSVQKRHNGEIIYNSERIHKFLVSKFPMKYNIDWDKYLSTERARKSNKKIEDNSLDKRNAFESDFGRVVFSSPLRRMHDKTQVIPLTSGDKIHTRLTHSIEVMNTAKSLALNLCRDQDFIDEYTEKKAFELEQSISSILMTAALVHDIGNPPFGHFGETIIQQYFKYNADNRLLKDIDNLDFTAFDGNAQGFRILTHTSYVGDLFGLNLTYATLGAYMKYPNAGIPDKKYIGTKKHGIYSSEKEIFDKIVAACNLKVGDRIKRHPLSFLVEAADSICYLVMDIEDGFLLRWF